VSVNTPKEKSLSRGTPIRPVRVPDHLWKAAMERADLRGETVSDALRWFLAEYAAGRITPALVQTAEE
jgi:hypothetical protein